jgi:hypothetical protein
MEVALANPDLNPVSAGLIPPDPSAEQRRLREEPARSARRGQEPGEAADDPRRDRRRTGGQLVPRTQTALYTSQARRGIAVYQDTAGFTPYQYQSGGGGIDLYA